MSVAEMMTETQDRMITELQANQERLVGYNKRMAEMIQGFLPTQMFGEALPAVPGMGELPKPAEMVDGYFDFTSKLADANRSFYKAMLDVWTPESE